MKLHLLHGPGIVSSRLKLHLIKNAFETNNVVVFARSDDPREAMGGLMTPSLFSQPKLIILENPQEDFNIEIVNIQDSTTLLVWLDHEIGAKSALLKFIKKHNGEILFFDGNKEVSIFPLLDHLAFKDKKAFLELQKLNTVGLDIYYVLTMVYYLLRNLVSTPKKAPEFVKKKLLRQRVNFPTEKNNYLYKSVLEIEFKLKRGLMDQSQAEFLLVSSFTD